MAGPFVASAVSRVAELSEVLKAKARRLHAQLVTEAGDTGRW
jgi:hypothetical protein